MGTPSSRMLKSSKPGRLYAQWSEVSTGSRWSFPKSSFAQRTRVSGAPPARTLRTSKVRPGQVGPRESP